MGRRLIRLLVREETGSALRFVYHGFAGKVSMYVMPAGEPASLKAVTELEADLLISKAMEKGYVEKK